MSLKREADPFIKPDPDAKRVKTEGGDGNFSLSSIPMAPPPPAAFAPSATSAVGPKIEGGDRKPLGPAPSFGSNPGKNRKKKFFGNSIKVRRGDDWVTAHFNKRTMVVNFTMHWPLTKQWSSVQIEQEVFERLNKAKFDIQPSEEWGFLDRKFFTDFEGCTVQPADARMHYGCDVHVQNLNEKKVENSPTHFKKDEPLSQPKRERFG